MKRVAFMWVDKEQIASRMRRAEPCLASTAAGPATGVGKEAGIALLVTLFVIFILSGLAVSLILLTDSEIRLERSMEAQANAYYAGLAGLEEARGRLNPSAPDTIATLPTAVTQVLYLVNSSTADPVQPTNPASPYYDREYVREFPDGLGAATVLSSVTSDQPDAGTAAALPYKWVRITLKTEYSSNQDVDWDGVLNRTTPIYWDGSQQDLSTRLPQGVAVYKLTALAVDPSGIRKLVQTEVAGAGGGLTASAAAATGGSATLNGVSVGGIPNLRLRGINVCGGPSLPGIMAGGTVAIPSGRVARITGSSPATVEYVSPFPQSAATLIGSLRASATPILNADPTHVSLAPDGASYVGTNLVLGTQAVGTTPAQPLVAYADKSLSLSGATGTGQGILLVHGDLSITGGFDYKGMIIVDGSVTLTSNATDTIAISGTLVSFGDLVADSSSSVLSRALVVRYDSCAIADGYQVLPKTVLAYRELP
jgi:hypothetical protein